MINTKDYKNIGKSLNDVKEVSKKLDYLKDEYTSSTELEEGVTFHMFFAHFIDKYFENDLRDPAFTYWFLKYNANQMFESYINTEKFKYKLSSKTKSNFIESELNSIYETEKRVEDLELKGELNDYEKYKSKKGCMYTLNDNIPLYEASRVLNNYYLDYATEHDYTISSYEVIAYFKHKLLKPYLLDELSESGLIDKGEDENEVRQTNLDKPNTFCRSMPLTIPYEHFKILTIKQSKNGEPFLTQKQFESFIDKAFRGKTDLDKIKFNKAPRGEKLKIQYLFRQFYENYCFEYFNTGQIQDAFIKLLTENFIGWDFKNVKNNFNTKPIKLM